MIDNTATDGVKFGIRKCLASAWLIVREHWFALVLAALVRGLLSLLAACLVFSIFVDWRGWNLLVALAAGWLTWSAVQSGYLKLCLNLCKTNEVQWKDLFSGLSFALQMLIASICVFAAVATGFVFLIVPGVILAIRLSLYGLALVDQKQGAFQSLLTSHRMLKGFGMYAACFLLIYVMGGCIITWLSCGFEAFFVISLATLYKHIKDKEANV